MLCLIYCQTQKLLLFPHWFDTLAVNARAISEILLNSHHYLPFVPYCQTKFIQFNTHIWSTPWHVFHRFYRCLIHHSTQNCYVNTTINTVTNMGTTQLHVYRVWYVGSVPNCHFSFVLIAFTLGVT